MWTITDSFTKFVFPFHMRLRNESPLSGLALSLTESLAFPEGTTAPCPLWVECQFELSELDNMLPYVKQYVRNPQNHRRFTINPALLCQLDNMQTSRMETVSPGFQISSVEMYLFFNGIGFLTLEINPRFKEDTPPSMAWIEDVNADLASLTQGKTMWQRFAAQSDNCAQEHLSMPALFRGEKMTVRGFIDSLLAPLCKQAEGPLACIEPLADTFLPVYGGILLTPEKNDPAQHRHTDDQFQEFVVSHGFVLRKTLPSSNRNRFSKQLLSDPLHNYMPYHNVVHTQSLEGGFVLAYDNGVGKYFSGRHSGAMQSFRTNYFYMMLLTLHQRMSILTYTAEASTASYHAEPARVLRTLREQIYDFTARCYFSQASYSEERDQLYRRWQRSFNIGQMYAELKEQVHDIDGHLAQLARDQDLVARQIELRQETARNRLIALVTLVLLPVSIGSGVIQASPVIANWFHAGKPLMVALLIALGCLVVCGLILLWLIIRQRRKN